MENNYKELQRADSKELMGKPKYKKGDKNRDKKGN